MKDVKALSDQVRQTAYDTHVYHAHGHIHYCCDYTLGKTRVLANPRGYPTESRTGFNPGLVAEV
ncbi:MAG TPA: hypothetical protein VJA21_32185 [Verrucomicrobiae bacterium]